MYFQKRRDRSGEEYYSFSYVDDNGKRVRLKKSEHPVIRDRKDAETWIKTRSAYLECRKREIKEKMKWKDTFYDFQELRGLFEKYQKKRAPNSFESSLQLFDNYVLDFFLNKKLSENIGQWYTLYPEFKNWLDDEAMTIGRNKHKLAYSTKNNIIHTLNNFITCMEEYRKIHKDYVKKCSTFPDHLKGARSFEDIVGQAEFKAIHLKLKEIHPGIADFYYVMFHSGLRFNELYGLPMSFIYKGQLDSHTPLHRELQEKKLEYYSYIVLESQPANKHRLREQDGSIERKPLKGRRKISHQNSRIIPILDRSAHDIMIRRYLQQKNALKKAVHGKNRINYMLFDDFRLTRAKTSLVNAYKGTNFEYKCWHCLRHSFCTRITGETRSFFLAREILGHRKASVFERYLHLSEQMVYEAKKISQTITEDDLFDSTVT